MCAGSRRGKGRIGDGRGRVIHNGGMSPMVSTWSTPATRDGYYMAETSLGLAATPDLWPVGAGDRTGPDVQAHGKVSDLQLAVPKILSSLWVMHPDLRGGLETCLSDAAAAYAAEVSLTSTWWRRTQAGEIVWQQAELGPGTVWLHHLSRYLEPHLHLHLLLPVRGMTEHGERALVPSLLHAGRYAAAARAASVVATYLRREGFETGGEVRDGWLTLRDGPAHANVRELHALSAHWSTGRKTRREALVEAASGHRSLSAQAVRMLDRLIVNRTARPDWQGERYDAGYGRLVEEHWLRTAAAVDSRSARMPRTDGDWDRGLTADRLYTLTATRDGRCDLRRVRERAWLLACHDPDSPADEGERALKVDAVVEECLAHRPVYAVADIEGRLETQTDRARIVGRGLATQAWVQACDWLRDALVSDDFPRLVLAAGPEGARTTRPELVSGWGVDRQPRVAGLIAPSGEDQSNLLQKLPAARCAYLTGPQGLDLTAPRSWLDAVRPLIPLDALQAVPPAGRGGLCVVAAQDRSDVELADVARRWSDGGWSVLFTIDPDDLFNGAGARSEALRWARRSDNVAVLECQDLGEEPMAAYSRRHRLAALLETGRPQGWEEGLRQCHVTTGRPVAGIGHRLAELADLDNLQTTVIASPTVLADVHVQRWPDVRFRTPQDVLNGKVEPAAHILLALDDAPRNTIGSRRLIVACRRLGTLLHMVSPWPEQETRHWLHGLRIQGQDTWHCLSDAGWDRLRLHLRPDPLPEPDRLHVALRERPRELLREQPAGRIRY